MPAAKKIIKAQINLPLVAQFNGEFTPVLAKKGGDSDIAGYFKQRYGASKVGQLEVQIDADIAKFRWILAKVVQEAESLHREALSKAKGHQYKQAIERWIKAISLNPEDPDYYFNAGIAFFEEKNYKEAIENLEYTLQLCPIYFKARLILGTIFLKLRKFENAELHLKESIYFNPQNALALLNLGAVYSILKKYDDAIAAFKRIIEISPKETRAYFGLGKIYSIRGDTQGANDCFRKVIELDSHSELANHARRAIVAEQHSHVTTTNDGEAKPEIDESHLDDFYAEGYKAFLYSDYARAADLYQKYVQYKSGDDNVWYALGESRLRAGMTQEAIVAAKNAIKNNPRKGLYYKQLAIAYDLIGNHEDAIAAAEKALELGKKDSIVYTVLGKNLIHSNDVAKAISNLEQALKINKANLSAEYHLALALAKSGDISGSSEHLRWILNSKVKTPLKAEAEKLLQDLSRRTA